MAFAAMLFVPPSGLTEVRAFLAFATPTPLVGWSQSRVLRRWSQRSWLWVLASTIGRGGFFAVEIFRNPSLAVIKSTCRQARERRDGTCGRQHGWRDGAWAAPSPAPLPASPGGNIAANAHGGMK
jgi:hypothetical protein